MQQMNDVTQSHLYNAAESVPSSITQPLPVAKPQCDAALHELQTMARYNALDTPFNIGKLYGKTTTVESLFAAIIESIKQKENDPVFSEKASQMLKNMQMLWQFFVATCGKQLTEPEILTIMSGYITSGYEKQKNQ